MKISSPEKVEHAFRQTLFSRPENIFPLLCPVMETKWVDGWDPKVVFTKSGFAEQDCIFINADNSVWVISKYDPEDYFVEFIKLVPETVVGKFAIRLISQKENITFAEIRYSYTAIGPGGKKFLEQFTTEQFTDFMQTWESELNYYLQHGTKKPTDSRPV